MKTVETIKAEIRELDTIITRCKERKSCARSQHELDVINNTILEKGAAKRALEWVLEEK